MNAQDNVAYTGPDALGRRLVDELAGILADFSEQCVIIGGMAHNFWREPRFTKDVDFTLVADPNLFERVRAAMEERGYVLSKIQNEEEPSGPGFARFVQPGTNKIVEFLTAKTEFQEQLIERGVRLDPAQVLRVATPEDVIVLKLIAGRSQDRVDAVALGLIEGLDWEYIQRWAEEWGVAERFEALQESLTDERARLAELFADKSPASPE